MRKLQRPARPARTQARCAPADGPAFARLQALQRALLGPHTIQAVGSLLRALLQPHAPADAAACSPPPAHRRCHRACRLPPAHRKQVKKGYVGIHSSGFKDFLLKPELLRAIQDCGFEHPSEGTSGRGRKCNGCGSWADAKCTACTHALAPRPRRPSSARPCICAVQHECIPQAILGMDVICQAKSGMGKTAVFVISTLQQLEPVDGQVGAGCAAPFSATAR